LTIVQDVPQVPTPSEGELVVPRDAKVVRVDPPVDSVIAVARDEEDTRWEQFRKSHLLFPEHRQKHGPLFERTPELKDINQHQMGDCWFLSALAAVVHSASGAFFKLIMRGDGNDVYVRLYDETRSPVFIVVSRSLIAVWGSSTYHSVGGLWAAVLEKAMTAFDKEGNFSPQGADYGRLKGGLAFIAFRILLGVEATLTLLEHHDQKSVLNEVEQSQLMPLLRGHGSILLPLQQALFGSLVKVQAELPLFYANVWGEWVAETRLGSQWTMAFLNHVAGGQVYRQEDFERFMRAFADQHESKWDWLQFRHDKSTLHLRLGNDFRGVRDAPTARWAVERVCAWARQQQVFSGRRGTGLYTPAQLALYNEIQGHLVAHRPVCLGTRKGVGVPDPTRGVSREHVSKGLAGPHSYAVFGCHTDVATGARFVQVFNPWGVKGRGYTFAPAELQLPPSQAAVRRTLERAQAGEKAERAYETESAVFWLDLADVTKRCEKLYTCPGASTPRLIEVSRSHGGLG
jgi:hypothetical protein